MLKTKNLKNKQKMKENESKFWFVIEFFWDCWLFILMFLRYVDILWNFYYFWYVLLLNLIPSLNVFGIKKIFEFPFFSEIFIICDDFCFWIYFRLLTFLGFKKFLNFRTFLTCILFLKCLIFWGFDDFWFLHFCDVLHITSLSYFYLKMKFVSVTLPQ